MGDMWFMGGDFNEIRTSGKRKEEDTKLKQILDSSGPLLDRWEWGK